MKLKKEVKISSEKHNLYFLVTCMMDLHFQLTHYFLEEQIDLEIVPSIESSLINKIQKLKEK